jgi:hypothetical protein
LGYSTEVADLSWTIAPWFRSLEFVFFRLLKFSSELIIGDAMVAVGNPLEVRAGPVLSERQ